MSALYGLGRGPHHCGGSLGGTEPFIKAPRFPRVRVAKTNVFFSLELFLPMNVAAKHVYYISATFITILSGALYNLYFLPA